MSGQAIFLPRHERGSALRAPRRRIAVPLAAVAIVVLAWLPAVVAAHYADGPGGAEVGLHRIDRGWQFLYHAVRLSRGTQLGSEGRALETAREAWAGRPAVASSVRLTYLDGPFPAPVPRDGTTPARADRVVEPRSRVGWAVTGAVCGGPPQLIGLLDYNSGEVAWNIAPGLSGCP